MRDATLSYTVYPEIFVFALFRAKPIFLILNLRHPKQREIKMHTHLELLT